jgi:glutathione S-transferase
MKLFDCRNAPSARRVRIFLAEKGIELSTEEIDVVNGDNLQPSYLAKNPRGVVPLLELDDGTCIDESVAICRYFEQQQPIPSLMGSDAKSAALVESRQRHIEFDGLLPLADIFRNATPAFKHRGIPGTTEVDAIDALVPRGQQSFTRFLERLEQLLVSSEYIAGAAFSIADITALCTIDFAKLARIMIPENHPNTSQWYEKVSSRPSYSA